MKLRPNLKVGCVFTYFYCRGIVKVLVSVPRSNSFRCTGYFVTFWSKFLRGFDSASKKGVWCQWSQCHRADGASSAEFGVSCMPYPQ